ncbi:hypothetical protein [Dactylosporangium sp. NPDC005555]|uniref:hypothetical protein n=1 Tax=Dactylosporangium sp. NPDC005555 TaxID=3154889 RepID=UPI0033B682AA
MLSTEVVESGPFTTMEQAMLATAVPGQKPLVTGLGRYNAVAAAAGSLGALAAAAPALLRRVLPTAPGDQRYFLALTAVSILGAYERTTCGQFTRQLRAGRCAECRLAVGRPPERAPTLVATTPESFRSSSRCPRRHGWSSAGTSPGRLRGHCAAKSTQVP